MIESQRVMLTRVFQVDAYPMYAASALAGNALVRCTFAGKNLTVWLADYMVLPELPLLVMLLTVPHSRLPTLWHTDV